MPLFGGSPDVRQLQAKRNVPGLIKALEHRQPAHVRIAAAIALGELADQRAIKALENALRDGTTPGIMTAASNALRRLGWQPKDDRQRAMLAIAEGRWQEAITYGSVATATLVAEIKHKDTRTRFKVAQTLDQIGSVQANEPLLAVLEILILDEDARIRRQVVHTLGQIRSGESSHALNLLVGVLRDTDREVRLTASQALVQLGTEVVQRLLSVLQDNNANAREAAAQALGQIGDARAVTSLLAALQDKNISVCCAVVEALGQLGDPKAIEPLMTVLNHLDERVGIRAAQELTKFGWQPQNDIEQAMLAAGQGNWTKAVSLGAVAVGPLVASLKDANRNNQWNVGKEVMRALAQLGGERAVKVAVAELTDINSPLREEAAKTLEKIGDSQAVAPLVAALSDRDWNVRKAAANALAKIGEPALEPLITTLGHRDEEVRWFAAETVDRINPDWAIAATTITNPFRLVNALTDQNTSVRMLASQAFIAMGDPAVALLVSALSNQDWKIRKAATQMLIMIGGVHVVESLIAVLEYHDAKVREAAVEILGRIGNTRAIELLATALRDQDRNVREAAVLALERNGSAGAETLVIGLRDPEWIIRKATALALGNSGDVRVGESLAAALRDTEWMVREAAAEALGDLCDVRAIEPLTTTLNDPTQKVREAASRSLNRIRNTPEGERRRPTLRDLYVNAYKTTEAPVPLSKDVGSHRSPTAAFGKRDYLAGRNTIAAELESNGRAAVVSLLGPLRDQIDDTQAVELLAVALRDTQWMVRKTAVQALGQIGSVRAVELLAVALRDTESMVRRTAVRALERIGDDHMVELLAVALRDPQEMVGIEAAHVLGRIGDVRAVGPLVEASLRRSNNALLFVGVIQSILEKHTQSIATEDLRAVADLPLIYYYHSSDNPDKMIQGYTPITCIPLRYLARQELIRRGVSA